MAFFTTTDNVAAIAMLMIKEKHGTLHGLRRWRALEIVKEEVAKVTTQFKVYEWERSDAVQKLMMRMVRDDQH